MSPSAPAASPRFVLVGTSHPGNIGSAARAMKTMGCRQLLLAAPECEPISEPAFAMAAGAHDLIEQHCPLPSLAEAIADCSLVFGCTARRRHVPLPEFSPRDAVLRMRHELQAGGRVAVVFGRERTGLSNDELQRCQAAIHIPSDPEFFSLNLAAAVQILAYEWRIADLAAAVEPAPAEAAEPVASSGEFEGFIGHLDRALLAIDFHKGRSPVTVMERLRRLFARARPDSRELRILRGILADVERSARLAAQPKAAP